ncbi:MAG TPA: peptidoglycan DD-metalloendopeptidase family protein [Gaiellaceae bacterium]|nr:peptidoglycan DD-metalloendopeptidase family protein [Gaiellaceae bacterium]
MAHRNTARGVLFLTLIALLCAGGAAAHDTLPAKKKGPVPTFVFPVLGETNYTDSFGDARGQGGHEGTDIMAPRWAPVVAAEDGTIKLWTTSARAGCMLYLYGKSGTTYLYIHLNNDKGQGNDNSGGCVTGVAYAPGLKNGAHVVAGQQIAFNGNSGDADSTGSHVHFEVHPGDGGAVNPYPYLKKARTLLFGATRGTTFTAALTGKVVAALGEDLRLGVQQLRVWPGGRTLAQSGQKVDVHVPGEATIEGVALAAGLAYPTLDLLKQGTTVTVWTTPAKVTLAAQAGEKGALSAARIVLKK